MLEYVPVNFTMVFINKFDQLRASLLKEARLAVVVRHRISREGRNL